MEHPGRLVPTSELLDETAVQAYLSQRLADALLADLGDAVAFLEKNPPAQPKAQAPTFAH